MPYILRDAETTDNPPLASVYGKQITAGKVVYYLGNKSIIILGDGEMDGIDQLLYNGELVDSANYVFHPGTLTKQIVPIDVTAISGETITLASNPYNTSTEKEVAIVAGLDPTPSPYPASVAQHQKLYVVYSSGNDVKLSFSDGGSPITWTSSAYLLANMTLYRANAGYFDTVQGRPTYFPDVEFTFSGIAYVEVQLTGDMAEIEDEPTKFQIFVRGRKLQNYDADGLIADEEGVAYPDQDNLPEQTKFFSANNALVAIDIILNYMKVAHSRINWATFVKFRDHCDFILDWNSGATEIFTYPNWTNVSPSFNGLDDTVESSLATLRKDNVNTAWDAGAISYQTVPDNFTKFKLQCIYRGGHSAIGIGRRTTATNIFSEMKYGFASGSIPPNDKLYIVENGSVNFSNPAIRDVGYGDRLRIECTQTNVDYYVNDELIYTTVATWGTGDPLRACIAFYSTDAKYSDIKMFPILGASRSINRFDAHLVFPSEIPSSTALEQVMGRAPSCHWQDVNGKISFIVGSEFVDLTLGETPTDGDRVLVRYLSYDTTQNMVKSNIVENSFSYYKKPTEEKQNFLRVEFRDIENEVFIKKYSFQDRPQLRDYAKSLIDFGVVQIGVSSQSLADRMGESILRMNSDLDLFVNVKGTYDTFDIAKGDIVRFAHDVPGWTLETAPTFIVVSETFDPDTADERTFTLQVYSEDFYSDTAHGAISPTLPSVTSRLIPPPPPSDLTLMEETRTLPDGTEYTTIVGTVFFDTSYPYNQRARVYWKRQTDVEYLPTSIVLEQPSPSITNMSFDLNFAPLGLNSVKVITETVTGLVSSGSIIEAIDISGTVQIDLVTWEGFVNTETLLGNLTKIAGTSAWDAGARSTKALHHGSGYVQWNINNTGKVAVGLSVYNNTTIALNTTSMLYGLIVEDGQQPIPVVSGSTVSAVGTTTAVGYGYKIEVNETANKVYFYEVIDGLASQIYETTRQNVYPLYVDASIYEPGDYISQPQFYGRLEQTTGYKVHWTNIAGVTITDETLTKVVGSDWANPNQGIAFSIEYLVGDGAVEFEASELGNYRGVGFSPVDIDFSDPTLLGYKSVRYMWYMKGTAFGEPPGTLTVVEGSSDGLSYNEYGGFTYAPGDILRVERVGTEIRYRQNGVLRYTSTVPSPIGELLHPDVAIYNNAATVKNIRIKKAGLFIPGVFPYPIYKATNLRVLESRPEEDGSVYVQLAGNFPTEEGATILRASVKVLDKFGNIVKSFPPFTYAGNGIIGQGHHSRKYADPASEAIYEIKVSNDDTTSQAIYLQGNGTTYTSSLTVPTLKNIANAVRDLTASVVDHTQITLAWTYSSNAQIQYRVGTTGTWSTAVTGLTSPYTVTGLVPNTYYEFRASPTGTTDNYSNIVRAKTQAAPTTPEALPTPLSLSGTLDSANPESKVNLTWTRNTTSNTGVKIYQNGTLIYTGSTPTEVSKQITGLSSNTAYTFKVKNIYSGGDSEFSNEFTITTGIVEGATRPSALHGNPVGVYRIDLYWTNHTSTGNIEIYRSPDGFDWSSGVYDTVPATVSFYSDLGVVSEETWFYKVKNTGVDGFSNIVSVSTDTDNPACVLAGTIIYCYLDGQLLYKRAWEVKEGDEVLTVLKGGEVTTTKVKHVLTGKANKMNVLVTSSGKSLICTLSHPLIVNEDLSVVNSHQIKVNYSILTYNDLLDKVQVEMVESKDTLEGEFDIVIFELEDKEHTFISNGIVSHNLQQKY